MNTAPAGPVYRESMDGIVLLVNRDGKVVAPYMTGKVPKEVQIGLA